MGRAEYSDLDVNTQRADSAIMRQCPVTPTDWIVAVKAARCKCERCRGKGTYYWGACINGVMSHSSPYARCGGKGWMNFDDMRRRKRPTPPARRKRPTQTISIIRHNQYDWNNQPIFSVFFIGRAFPLAIQAGAGILQ